MKFVFASLLIVQCSLAATFPVRMSTNPLGFAPANLTINVGDTVTWSDVLGIHDTVSGTGGVPDETWNSGLMVPGQSFSFTFTRPGNYPYYCTPHWTLGMVGTIRVMAPNSPPTVSFISPGDRADFPAPADITVEASASDSDGRVTQVELSMNGTSLGVFTGAPYRTTVRNLGPGNYTFSAVAMDDAGATGSASVSLTVSGQQPTITVPPQSQEAVVGNDVAFGVQATGSGPLRYQWLFGLNPIPGATTSSLVLTNVGFADAGAYTVQVSNDFGTTSASAALTVTNAGTAPSITNQPQAQTVTGGSDVTFVAGASGSSPFVWQWFFNGAPIANATNLFLTLTNVSLADAGEYFVTVRNDVGSATSAIATLSVCSFALATPDASFKAHGGSGSVAVTASPGCSWTAINTSPWIAITSGNGGTGTGTVTFTVDPNTSPNGRNGALVIAGISFNVSQSGLFPAKNDFNHDGETDILWQAGDGRVILWLMDGLTRIAAMPLRNGRPAPLGSRIVGTDDFDVDGNVDILWQRSSGALEIWFMNHTNFLRAELISPAPVLGPAWQAVGLGDFNHDNSTDILFRHNEGYLLVWYMKGKRFLRQQLLVNGEAMPLAWRVAAVADLDNDGQADIVWQKPNNSLVVWYDPGATATAVMLSNLPKADARLVGLNDLDQDGKLDFIWRFADGHFSAWSMKGTNLNVLTINGGQGAPATWKYGAPRN